MPAVQLCTFQGGKISEMHHYFDTMTMMRHFGLAPAYSNRSITAKP